MSQFDEGTTLQSRRPRKKRKAGPEGAQCLSTERCNQCAVFWAIYRFDPEVITSGAMLLHSKHLHDAHMIPPYCPDDLK